MLATAPPVPLAAAAAHQLEWHRDDGRCDWRSVSNRNETEQTQNQAEQKNKKLQNVGAIKAKRSELEEREGTESHLKYAVDELSLCGPKRQLHSYNGGKISTSNVQRE
jgi:hypothetical protein